MSQREEETESKLSFFDSLVGLFKKKEQKAEWLHYTAHPKLCVCEIEVLDEPDFYGNVAEIQLFQSGERKSVRRVQPGDFYRASHTISIVANKRIEKDSPIFPIEFEYAGETYFLRATKNDKLILTK